MDACIDSARPAAERGLVQFDEDGFLARPDDWNTRLAEELARQAGIDQLTARHWQVIGLVRDRYFTLGALPVMRLVCRAAGLDPAKAHRLFSSCRSLWRIAGLPNPGEEAKSYMN
ncbi:MAG: TusE/DsrC/DsvC family sulfur relay protein [Burkholderiales bacterium]|jgi:tRNA 2-thiouridine synthesizing protein E|nr:TusE/DsrC/DsvC family sulfur relay protein [Burkholderiales bacterium]